MNVFPEGNAIIYCEGAFTTANGKTAHGLVRRTERYRILSVVDSLQAGRDAGTVLDGSPRGIPIHGSVRDSVEFFKNSGNAATHLVIGLAPDGGRLSQKARGHVLEAMELGLHVDSGLHDFLCEDKEISRMASANGLRIRDVRKPPPRKGLHFFSGKIDEVNSLKVAVLGTDSAVGKRTTAWVLLDALRMEDYTAEFVGTGQTAWMQGVRYGIILDSLVNDFVSGEIEHAIWSVWKEMRPDTVLIEGQGSLLNPAYPGGFEILAAGRPDVVILQHAPARREYDGFPGYPLHSLEKQIQAVELISEKPVIALTINHENMGFDEVPEMCSEITDALGLPACDVLLQGANGVLDALRPYLQKVKEDR